MNQTTSDLVGLFATLAIFFFGVSQDTANQVGAWIALFSASVCGALVALGMAEAKEWWWVRMVWFVFIRVFASMMLSMSIVILIAKQFPGFGPGIVLAPVAFLVTCDPMRAWAIKIIKRNAPEFIKKALGDDK